MNPTETIKAAELVRRIRDEQSRELAGKSVEQVLDFYRRAGEEGKRAAANLIVRRRTVDSRASNLRVNLAAALGAPNAFRRARLASASAEDAPAGYAPR